MARSLVVDPCHPDRGALDEAGRCLARNGLIAFPTESFYGLGVMATSAEAVARLFAVKRRPADQPAPVVVADRHQVAQVIETIPLLAERLMARFWPGPLTLVMAARANIPMQLTGGTGRLGVRQPGLPLPVLLAAVAGPITATSANRSGAQPATAAPVVEAVFRDEIDLILDGGATPGGLPSTVLDVTVDPPRLVRRGRIPDDQLLEVCALVQPPDAAGL
ncbi:MAG TPA: L-threonylcarbamoyladenylate synthase [Nitrospiria bacterium]|nr:L-threonylcarbamoyladenylate synthase [Nitrospiria bacterium]